METHDLLNSSHPVKDLINPCRVLIKFQWYNSFGQKHSSPVTRDLIDLYHLPQLQGATLTPTIYISNSSEDTPALNVNGTSIISKSANLLCIPNRTKSQNLNKHQKEQTITETENLCAEMIFLKSFVVDKIYMWKKGQMIKIMSFWSKTWSNRIFKSRIKK